MIYNMCFKTSVIRQPVIPDGVSLFGVLKPFMVEFDSVELFRFPQRHNFRLALKPRWTEH